MKRLWRIGIIGCNGIAKNHLRGILASPDLALSALCDIIPERMDELASSFGISEVNFFTNYEEMLRSGVVDAVSICTPNNSHFAIVKAAVNNRIPYAVEKPVCNQAKDVDQLVSLTRQIQLAHMVCFSYRFIAGIRYMRDIVQSGQLGRIFHVESVYNQSWSLPGSQNGQDVPLIWRFIREISGSGALGDLGSHLIDLNRFITGREFVYVIADGDTFIRERKLPGQDIETGKVDVDDYMNIVGQLEGQVAVQLGITRYAYGRGNHQHIEVYGELGALSYDVDEAFGESLSVNIGNLPMRQNHIWSAVPIPVQYASDQMQSFADILNNRSDGMAAQIEDGYINQRIIDQVIISSQQGRRISL